MTLTWLMRAKRWVQHPPSPGRVKLVLAVIGLCAALVFYEKVFGWPEALSVHPPLRVPR